MSLNAGWGKYEVSRDAIVCRFHHSQRAPQDEAHPSSTLSCDELYSRFRLRNFAASKLGSLYLNLSCTVHTAR